MLGAFFLFYDNGWTLSGFNIAATGTFLPLLAMMLGLTIMLKRRN